ncbi:MAG TPA: class I SAM-dependent methyltransferase [Solirubrobacterales bacterium]|nr:class I SAM-dependent methyltransferase [Solirubrobacterales bacterium]
MNVLGKLRAILEERLALMAPSRRLRLALADQVLSGEAAGSPLRVLDAGCGDGLLTLSLAGRHGDWALLGVDQRTDLLDGARARAVGRSLGNVRFQPADLTQPLPEGNFDAVVALECLHEIPDDAAALRTMAGALRPGGLLALQVPERDWAPVLPGSTGIWREEVRHGYGREEIAADVRAAGLEPVEMLPTYRSLAAAAQEIRDRIKGAPLLVRLLAFPFLAAAVRIERLGLTWGKPSATLVLARRPAQ